MTTEEQVYEAKINLIEIARQNIEANSQRPFGTLREFKLIEIMNTVSLHGIPTELVTCERSDFEKKKSELQPK